jgi:hypothetical protein
MYLSHLIHRDLGHWRGPSVGLTTPSAFFLPPPPLSLSLSLGSSNLRTVNWMLGYSHPVVGEGVLSSVGNSGLLHRNKVEQFQAGNPSIMKLHLVPFEETGSRQDSGGGQQKSSLCLSSPKYFVVLCRVEFTFVGEWARSIKKEKFP